MSSRIRPLESGDKPFILDILNYYIQTSFAAFAEDRIRQKECSQLIAASRGYPFYVLENEPQQVVGFARLRPYRRFQTFRTASVWTCFILPEYTGSGHGKALLFRLMKHAKTMGIENILAEISSENKHSLKFHEKHGFRECGCLKRIGLKFGRPFDIILMQKMLSI